MARSAARVHLVRATAAGRDEHHLRVATVLAVVAIIAPLGAIVAAPSAVAVAARSVPRVRAQARPAIPRGAKRSGPLAATQTIHGVIGFKVRDPDELQAYATNVSNPSSPLYRSYLTPATYRSWFGPSVSQVTATAADLRAAGLRVGKLSADGLLLPFRGPSSAVADAFGTSFNTYRLRGGRSGYANTSAATLPATIASSVQTILGLNDLVRVRAATRPAARGMAAGTPKAASGGPAPCPAASKSATTNADYTFDQLGHAYGLDPLFKAGDFGAGQTIALFEQDAFSRSEIHGFDKCYFGDSAATAMMRRLTLHNVDGGFSRGTGFETPLDIEDVSALAPEANIQVWEAPPTFQDGFVEQAEMIDQDQAQLLSESYGSCEPELEATYPGVLQMENSMFEQAAAQGQTFLASSADNGSDTCSEDSGQPVAPLLSMSDPASQPFVLDVGGTAITAPTDPATEEVWNDGSAGGASGGGISATWAETSWQEHDNVPGLNASSSISKAESIAGDSFCQDDAEYAHQTCREGPDVSADGSPNTGAMVFRVGAQWVPIGGTSSSTPLWAAMLADINSTARCGADNAVGFVPPKLYDIASDPAEYAASFNDITIGNNDNFGAADGTYPATTGFDMATGLGSPRITGPGGSHGLAYYLCSPPPAARPTVTDLSPVAAPVSGGGSLAVTGSGFEAAGKSTVTGVSIGGFDVPAADISVASNTVVKVSPIPAASTVAGAGAATDGAGDYNVSVTVAGGATSQESSATRFMYFDSDGGANSTPTIVGTDPNGGPEAGGNTVHVFGAGFNNSADPVTAVTFGSKPASSFTVVSDTEITAVPPAYKPSDCLPEDDPSNDVCQVNVQVVTAGGSSAVDTLAPQFNGDLSQAPDDQAGIYPQPTEYDYSVAPTLDSITLDDGEADASAQGGTVATVTGKGLGIINFVGVTVGPPNQESSFTFTPLVDTGTSLTFVLPPEPPTKTPLTLAVSVLSLAAPHGGDVGATPPAADSESVTYAPAPTISKISTGTTPISGPTSGGTELTIDGTGFDTAQEVRFKNHGPYGLTASTFDVSATSTTVRVKTPAAITGSYRVEVCNDSGCSDQSKQTFIFYLPGDPQLISATPRHGPKGTTVTVTGNNLGWLTGVYFGSTRATTFSNTPKGFQGFESGNTSTFTVKAPASAKGKVQDIRVTTVESQATGFGESHVVDKATFRRT